MLRARHPRLRFRQRHARLLGEPLHRFGKAQALLFDEESEDVTRLPAAETVIASLAVVRMEGRRLLIVEGAARPEIAARGDRLAPVPLHAPADDRGYVNPVSDLVEQSWWKFHAPLPPPTNRMAPTLRRGPSDRVIPAIHSNYPQYRTKGNVRERRLLYRQDGREKQSILQTRSIRNTFRRRPAMKLSRRSIFTTLAAAGAATGIAPDKLSAQTENQRPHPWGLRLTPA